jgi:hypothetical protein
MLCRPSASAQWQSPTKSTAQEQLACHSPKAGHVRRVLASLRQSFSTESELSRVPVPRTSVSRASKVPSPMGKLALSPRAVNPLRSSMPTLQPSEVATKPAVHSGRLQRSPLKAVHARRAFNAAALGSGVCPAVVLPVCQVLHSHMHGAFTPIEHSTHSCTWDKPS